ncbi:MAG: peptidoglycan recognition protein family protein [Planctomycetota bacterium]
MPVDVPSSRRAFLLAGVGLLLTGCSQQQTAESSLPGPVWEPRPAPAPDTRPPVKAATPAPATSNVIARTNWASGSPVPTLMNRMRPVRYITVHHDGMSPFFGGDARAAAARLEAIRRGHRGRGWGDIGYHYAVDRGGRVWQARPVGWQGAHVKDHNEGNIGIVVLGNFDRQTATRAQIEGLHRHLATVMRTYRVPASRVRTHQEWAPTACPGRSLQYHMNDARRNGRIRA